jgi:hypothetical protein
MRDMRWHVRFAAIAVLAFLLGGCGSDGPDKQEVAARADAARTQIDRLAAAVGTVPQTKQDVVSDCVPGDRDSGQMLLYTIRVTVDANAADRLRGEVSDDLATEGWTVKPEPSGPGVGETVAFQKGNATMSASVFADKGYAVVTGSGGCVR